MDEIKAIETRYKGCRFRSRLEARWAVAFDVMNVPWEYEPEGFELPDGARYLPDFYLPDERTHVEIKPTRPGCIEGIEKAVKFVDGEKIKRLLILPSIPKIEKRFPMFPMVYFDNLYFDKKVIWMDWVSFDEKRAFLIPGDGETYARIWINKMKDISKTLGEDKIENEIVYYGGEACEDVIERSLENKAYIAARSARFEFGEEG